MSRKTVFATGPAAYHARLERERIASLEAEVATLRARLVDWSSPYAVGVAVRDAVKQGHAAGYDLGYSHGAKDALNPTWPGHSKALACTATDGV